MHNRRPPTAGLTEAKTLVRPFLTIFLWTELQPRGSLVNSDTPGTIAASKHASLRRYAATPPRAARNHAVRLPSITQRNAKLRNSETRRVLDGFDQFKICRCHDRHGPPDRPIARPPRPPDCTQNTARKQPRDRRQSDRPAPIYLSERYIVKKAVLIFYAPLPMMWPV